MSKVTPLPPKYKPHNRKPFFQDNDPTVEPERKAKDRNFKYTVLGALVYLAALAYIIWYILH